MVGGDINSAPGAYLFGAEYGEQIWVNSGMSEFLNPLIINTGDSRAPVSGRKFVDKWIAIRLICNSTQNLVNLLSTKVGTRKYHRHDK